MDQFQKIQNVNYLFSMFLNFKIKMKTPKYFLLEITNMKMRQDKYKTTLKVGKAVQKFKFRHYKLIIVDDNEMYHLYTTRNKLIAVFHDVSFLFVILI